MTNKKFKRLFIVLLAPLLFSGAMLAMFYNKSNQSIRMRCESGSYLGQICRVTDWGEIDEHVAKDFPVWFDVNTRSYENNKFPKDYVSASVRKIDGVQILEVLPYAKMEDIPNSSLNNLRSLSGQRISIIFGIENNEYRDLNPLGCNELNFEEGRSDVFVAGLCGIPNEIVQVKFRVDPQGQKELVGLKNAIDEKIENAQHVMIINYVIITPIFLVIFLIISIFIFIIRKSYDYICSD